MVVANPFPDHFCDDPLWDSDLSWNTTDPDFTNCFQQTVLVWIPCFFLWIMMPWQGYSIVSSQFKITRWTWISSAKMAFSLVLFALSIMDMSYVTHQWLEAKMDALPNVELVAPLIKAGTFLLSAFYIFTDKRSAKPSSGVLFFFWLLLLIGGLVTLRTTLSMAITKGVQNQFRFVIYIIYFTVVCAQFFLSCFAEYFPEQNREGIKPCPEQFASLPNRWTFWWFTPLTILGWKQPLKQTDLWDLNPGDRIHIFSDLLNKYWHEEMLKTKRSESDIPNQLSPKTVHKPSLVWVLAKTFWIPFLMSGLMRALHDMFVFIAPQLLQLLIGFISDLHVQQWKGYFYAVLLLIASTVQTLLVLQANHKILRIGIHIRSAIGAVIYGKALRITSAAKRSSTVGEIVNLMSVDAQRLYDVVVYFHFLWSGPFIITLAVYFLYQQLGPSVFSGLAVLVLMIPINAIIASRTRLLQIAQMKEKDRRIKLLNEILNGMKVLKLYTWEESFEKQVLEIRDCELKTLKKAAFLNVQGSFSWNFSPLLVALVSFATYVLVDEKNILDSQKAFVSLALFNIIRSPLSVFPNSITAIVQAKVSLDRISKFLQNEELDLSNVQMMKANDSSTVSAVSVVNGNFSWSRDDPITLKNINLDARPGQLIAIAGQVGYGKSSLVSALLGLMERRSGSVIVKNLSLKDNILFGKPMDEKRYDAVVKACALGPDLEMLPAGDETEIGEKGINLSGGQKQRVSLARAVYSEADVCFLDDPLSAVDAHVGRHLFENVIGPKGLLAGKTRILVTHGISFLPQADLIVVLDRGKISEIGSYQQLLQNNGAFAEFLRSYTLEKSDNEDDPEVAIVKQKIMTEISEPVRVQRATSVTSKSSAVSTRKVRQGFSRGSRRGSQTTSVKDTSQLLSVVKPIPLGAKRSGDLVETEKSEIGSVKWNVYLMFLKHVSYGTLIGALCSYVIFNGLGIGSSIWLGEWSEDAYIPERRNSTSWRNHRLVIYAVLGGTQGVFIFISALMLAIGQIHASRKLHENMLVKIIRAPMSFFDTTPIGRIVNRFSKDVDTIDTMLPMNNRMWLDYLFMVFSTIIVICISVPLFALVIVPIGVLYSFIQRFYIATSRQLKRLESVSRSPIYAHFQESLNGASTILATKQTDRFVHDNEERLDLNNTSAYFNVVSQRWLALRLETIGNLMTFFAALFAVIGRERGWGEAKDIGLSISYALGVTQTLNWLVRMASDLETNVVSVERIKEYTEIATEADWVIPDRRPTEDWPQNGNIIFNDYKVRYRPDLDLVLKGLTAEIMSLEKVGIVGRTGAGKSSLTLALFRIIESAAGSIIIDGMDISKIGLHDVRSRITIIPQEPVLFSGTLRLNLDPFNIHTDSQLWCALENSHLKNFVSALPNGLQHVVAESGENLSVGQRQLICLARALLRKTKILVLDEATAAVDLETGTIREKFADCTILTIAHRLNTIMDSTRIMVLDQGNIKEFDSPQTLLADQNSLFYRLAKDANLI